jgi:hypothetical protein
MCPTFLVVLSLPPTQLQQPLAARLLPTLRSTACKTTCFSTSCIAVAVVYCRCSGCTVRGGGGGLVLGLPTDQGLHPAACTGQRYNGVLQGIVHKQLL